MAVLNLTKSTTVAQLKKEFNETFGAVLRIYSGRSQAEETTTEATQTETASGSEAETTPLI